MRLIFNKQSMKISEHINHSILLRNKDRKKSKDREGVGGTEVPNFDRISIASDKFL